MFGTVILDAYRKDEKYEIANALEDLCSPNDHYGWASAGIYCFWDYYAEAILYMGLASDLCIRFKQHNGILSAENGSKQVEIANYFTKNERLGFTVFVQSSLSQPLTYRNKLQYKDFAEQTNSPINDHFSDVGINDIKRVEGILLESYRRKYGYFPPWNKMNGSLDGQKKVMENNINIVKSFCDPDGYYRNPIMSRSTLRELSSNPTYERYENYLHIVRMYILIFGMEFSEALEFANKHDGYKCYEDIKQSDYFKKSLII